MDYSKTKINKRNIILNWDRMYNLAQEYYNFYGNLEVVKNFKTKNGYEYDENGFNLGIWIITQRENTKLSADKREKLEKINMRFTNKYKKLSWEEAYKLVKIYYEHYGNLRMQKNFKTINGYEYDIGGYNLDSWIKKQKKQLNLKSEHQNKLEQLGIEFYDISWNEMYYLVTIYYNHYKTLEMPLNIDGYNLDKWLSNQKQNRNLSKEKLKKLEQIGLEIENNNLVLSWDEMYALAKVYYNYYKTLEIPLNFKTKNGYEYDIDGYNLGSWIRLQKNNNSISKIKKEKLELIGMIFSIKQNRYQILLLCNKYNIDINKNYNILKNISYQELLLKIWYLVNNHINIFNENGFLHEIFSMNNINMKIKYNINLEEIMCQVNLKENENVYQYVFK